MQSSKEHAQMESIMPHSDQDITFWLQRITEHSLIIYMLLNEKVLPRFKQEALGFYNEWYNNGGVYDGNLLNRFFAFLITLSMEIPHISGSSEILSREYLGNVIHHMLMEQSYFIRLLEGKITVANELSFWTRETSEHSGLLGDILQEKVFQSIPKKLNGVDSVQTLDDQMGLFVSNARVLEEKNKSMAENEKHTVENIMLQHELTESAYGQQRLAYIQNLMKSA